jgi:hypothetical protein
LNFITEAISFLALVANSLYNNKQCCYPFLLSG